jgi:hypothetical protein
MLRKFGVKILVLAMMSVMLTTDSLAQTRIRFARGRTSATVSGTLAAGQTRGFVLGARRGQTLTATLSCRNGKCDFTQGDRHDTQYSQYVDSNGDVYISIDNHGNRATSYTMTVSIQ